MKKAEVHIGGIYVALVAGKITRIRLTEDHPQKGWLAVNLATNRTIRVHTAARLRCVARSDEDMAAAIIKRQQLRDEVAR